MDLIIDTTECSQRFSTDCEVCCRPIDVMAVCEPGLLIELSVVGS
ncbi:MAG: CPXCG motif-containing cysteine-rich protein [Verrucomicrobia bacterium]|jgi:hypothetical protein|nr:CPXCG motif-containing cysteine-rich protein [Verrucomicrobiota bacterium]